MSITLTGETLLVINMPLSIAAYDIENKEDLTNLKAEVEGLFKSCQDILNNLEDQYEMYPLVHDIESLENGETVHNDNTDEDEYGLSKIKNKVLSEIDKYWNMTNENELEYYDGKYASGFRKCDIDEGDSDYDAPLTIADDWSDIEISAESDMTIAELKDKLYKAVDDYKDQGITFEVRQKWEDIYLHIS